MTTWIRPAAVSAAALLTLIAMLAAACLQGPTRRTGDDDDATAEPDDDDTTADPGDDDDATTDPGDDDDVTSDPGDPIEDPEQLVGRVFDMDFASGTFLEPPGIGSILSSQLGDTALLFAVTDDSVLDDEAQPGLHMRGALGTTDDPPQQEPCGESLELTAGPDRGIPTEDDEPGVFDNPSFTIGRTTLALRVQGLDFTIDEALISGTWNAEMTEMVDGSISGTLDTRPLAPLLDPEGGEEALCELMQDTLGVPCLECGGSDPGEFCLEVVAVDLVAPLVPDETLLPVSCEDIITGFLSGGTCESQAMGFDPDADGSFSGCPGFGG